MKNTDISTEALGAICVYNENDEIVRLSDLWANTKTILVFVRHFG